MEKKRWCSSCTRAVVVEQTDLGLICCTRCGKVLEEDIFSTEATFVKDAGGRSRLAGSLVSTIQGRDSVSRERTLQNAEDTIRYIADNLGVGGGDQICLPARRFYEIALMRNFTRGRRADQVAASCLYIACRENNKPFLLIEFSEILRVNVYVLGAVFLQLCKLLRLEEHPFIQKLVDPSLFIHRFASGLLGVGNQDVERTALHIVASMKRDWMQTGRKPSGICGAALYIAALSHGYKFSKADIVKIVHICEATLTKRLIEFEDTESGSLTIEEFTRKAEELEGLGNLVKKAEKGDLLCEHRGSGEPHFAHGLCETCYGEFVKISGGLDGGSEPPAFQRAERERLARARADENAADSLPEPIKGIAKESGSLDNGGNDQFTITGDTGEHEAVDGGNDKPEKADYVGAEGDESESFSDIDDAEVDGYLHNEEEKVMKKIAWEAMNWEYLQEQAAKEAAAREASLANNLNCSEDMLAARELLSAASANAAKSRKERQQKRAAEAKSAQTPAEAAFQTLSKKRVSSKLNYEKLQELLDVPQVVSDNPKKSKTEKHSEDHELSHINGIEAEDHELSHINGIEAENDEDGPKAMDDYEQENAYEEYQEHEYSYYDNEEEYEHLGDEFF